MPKILRIINRFNLGGPTYNATFLSAFLSEDFETRLIGGPHEANEGSSLFIPQKYGVVAEIVPEFQRKVSFFRDRKAIEAVRKIIREYKPDIVHTHASKAGAVGRIAAYKEKVPIIVHTFHGHVFHSYFGRLKTSIYLFAERWLARRTDAIVAISDTQMRELTETYKVAPKYKFRTIELGFDLDPFAVDKEKKRTDFRKRYGLSDDSVAIGIIGRLTAIKNHEGFFEIIRRLAPNTKTPFEVFVIGDGELADQLKGRALQIEKEAGRSIFRFTSWITDIAGMIQGLDIVALYSRNEGTPVSLIESQAAGVPVITTRTGGVQDVVLEGETGFIVEIGESDLYLSRLQELVNDENLRKKMSQNGWKHVQERYHYRRLCAETEQLYLELLRKKAK